MTGHTVIYSHAIALRSPGLTHTSQAGVLAAAKDMSAILMAEKHKNAGSILHILYAISGIDIGYADPRSETPK